MAKVRFRCRDLPWRAAGECVDFTPSYPAESQDEYNAYVQESLNYLNDPEVFEKKFRRMAHLPIPGGRTQLRFPGHRLPKDRSKGGPEAAGTRKGPATVQRLKAGEPPWDARTQSPASRARKNSGTLEIEQALDAWLNVHPSGFRVPHSKQTLVDAGFPSKAAWILVTRCPGRFFPTVASQVEIKPAALISKALGSPILLVEDFEGARPVYLLKVGVGTTKWGRRGANLEALVVHNTDTGEEERISGNIIARNAFSRKIPGATAQVINEVVASTLEELNWAPAQVKIHAIVKDEVAASVSLGEHSKLSASLSRAAKVDYRNLQNVSLAQLPDVLVRLMNHKEKRKGRRLPRL